MRNSKRRGIESELDSLLAKWSSEEQFAFERMELILNLLLLRRLESLLENCTDKTRMLASRRKVSQEACPEKGEEKNYRMRYEKFVLENSQLTGLSFFNLSPKSLSDIALEESGDKIEEIGKYISYFPYGLRKLFLSDLSFPQFRYFASSAFRNAEELGNLLSDISSIDLSQKSVSHKTFGAFLVRVSEEARKESECRGEGALFPIGQTELLERIAGAWTSPYNVAVFTLRGHSSDETDFFLRNFARGDILLVSGWIFDRCSERFKDTLLMAEEGFPGLRDNYIWGKIPFVSAFPKNESALIKAFDEDVRKACRHRGVPVAVSYTLFRNGRPMSAKGVARVFSSLGFLWEMFEGSSRACELDPLDWESFSVSVRDSEGRRISLLERNRNEALGEEEGLAIFWETVMESSKFWRKYCLRNPESLFGEVLETVPSRRDILPLEVRTGRKGEEVLVCPALDTVRFNYHDYLAFIECCSKDGEKAGREVFLEKIKERTGISPLADCLEETSDENPAVTAQWRKTFLESLKQETGFGAAVKEASLEEAFVRFVIEHDGIPAKLNPNGPQGKGNPDLYIINDSGRPFVVEVKNPNGTGKLSEEQKEKLAKYKGKGIPSYVLDSFEDIERVWRAGGGEFES